MRWVKERERERKDMRDIGKRKREERNESEGDTRETGGRKRKKKIERKKNITRLCDREKTETERE